jgi:hypothetical protein
LNTAGRGKGKGADLQRAKFYLKHRGKEEGRGGGRERGSWPAGGKVLLVSLTAQLIPLEPHQISLVG